MWNYLMIGPCMRQSAPPSKSTLRNLSIKCNNCILLMINGITIISMAFVFNNDFIMFVWFISLSLLSLLNYVIVITTTELIISGHPFKTYVSGSYCDVWRCLWENKIVQFLVGINLFCKLFYWVVFRCILCNIIRIESHINNVCNS